MTDAPLRLPDLLNAERAPDRLVSEAIDGVKQDGEKVLGFLWNCVPVHSLPGAEQADRKQM